MSGLKELHRHNIVHGNIKAQNILLFSRTPSDITYKLADFSVFGTGSSNNSVTSNTPIECLNGSAHTNSSDIW